MNFLKENAFLVILVLALVIPSAGVLVWINSVTDTGDEYADLRTDLSRDITGQAANAVNEAVKMAAERNVATMREYHRKVAGDFLKRSEVYRPMRFSAEDTGGQAADAFPIRRELYSEGGMRLQFPVRYRKTLEAMLARLKPTVPPTAEEIRAETESIMEKEKGGAVGPGVGVPLQRGLMPIGPEMLEPEYGPRYRTPIGPGPAGRGPAGRGVPGKPEQREKMPQERAIEKTVAARSAMGQIYADMAALDNLLRTGMDYNDEDLYFAQVAAWVQQDIIEAIVRTNANARTRVKGKLRGVQSSAVKRLVSTRVRGYVVNQQGMGGGMGGMGGGMGGMGGGMGGGPEGPGGTGVQPPGAGGMVPAAAVNMAYAGRPATATAAAFGGRPAGRPGVGGGIPRLTGRVTNRLYDVVHYEFTVVISGPELLKLYDQLLRRNYHTILEVAVRKASRTGAVAAAAGGGPAGGMGGVGGQQDLYDYGSGPVVEATIVGEMLFVTNWTRGRRDLTTKDWNRGYPPLMPVAFLSILRARDAAALRPEDDARLTPTPIAATPRLGG